MLVIDGGVLGERRNGGVSGGGRDGGVELWEARECAIEVGDYVDALVEVGWRFRHFLFGGVSI